ncbi:hypothetical protein VCUG_02025 [Vavraia culicis subsp. floridensis]|uniref:Uncharacterized protein n=1 Tax=Vavraia culicis (isolate floridensis) TaxID=948595 RepID=L2GS44_VAVCU|nr:uncharacterized protein VCUG_02025 [Vavraia culicis subsp. floridensis]ELA46481.1 hypothetical protein VCUG_02025 [Vavraia culicis subsp. floridensis]
MGIKGLLPIVSPCLKKRHISAFKNHRIGIDGHSWLHCILPSIALQLYNNVRTHLHHDIFLKRIQGVRKHGVIPVVVFDGDSLPSKCVINERRRTKREEARRMAEIEMSKGNVRDAMRYMAGSISISREMVAEIAQFLKQNDVEVIISPYESDAQLSYLQRINYIHSIMTEDSDLIVYNCNNILYKYANNHVMHYERSVFREKNDFLCDNLLDVCILSGCDYLENVKGVGINSAIKLMKKLRSVELVVNEMRRTKSVPESYLSNFIKARLTFKYQVVYDPVKNERVYLDGSSNSRNYEFLGCISAKIGQAVCAKQEYLSYTAATSHDEQAVKREFIGGGVDLKIAHRENARECAVYEVNGRVNGRSTVTCVETSTVAHHIKDSSTIQVCISPKKHAAKNYRNKMIERMAERKENK